ncbi:MAG: hypothetical protein Q9187_001454 [Circinaria calcarea]
MSLYAPGFLLRPLARQRLSRTAFADTFFGDSYSQRRRLHYDGRSRLSEFWTPTGTIAKEGNEREDSHSMLIRGGFVRQAHSGLFHFLPLGLRIQEKLERLLDKHMVKLGASKVSLSTLSAEDLWEKSGRLRGDNPEVIANGEARKYRDEPRPRQGLLRTREFLMKDLYTFDYTKQDALQTYEAIRQGYSAFFDEFKIPYLVAKADSGSIGGDLSHEYHFPTSKGEDDLITCDSCDYVVNEEIAKSPFIYYRDSGNNKNFYFSYKAVHGDAFINLAELGVPEKMRTKIKSWYGISSCRNILYHAILPCQVANGNGSNVREAHINPYALKAHCEDVDLGVKNPLELFKEYAQGKLGGSLRDKPAVVEQFFDYRLPESLIEEYHSCPNVIAQGPQWECFHEHSSSDEPSMDLVRIEAGDNCPECHSGSLRFQKAVELGHTFFLGTRYSQPLEATVATPSVSPEIDNGNELLSDGNDILKPVHQSSTAALQMGCHGIGVSRMIAAVADSLADDKGLNWPRVMAPFEAVVIPARGLEDDAAEVLDLLGSPWTRPSSRQEQKEKEILTIDAILDDREKEMAWKLKDADLIGYPVIVVLGRVWRKERKCEVQCRRLGSLKRDVLLDELRDFVASLLVQL